MASTKDSNACEHKSVPVSDIASQLEYFQTQTKMLQQYNKHTVQYVEMIEAENKRLQNENTSLTQKLNECKETAMINGVPYNINDLYEENVTLKQQLKDASVINNGVPEERKQNFELSTIMIPNNDDSDDSDPPSITEITEQEMNNNSPSISPQTITSKKRSNKKRVRRNSDTIVFTPTTASAISDSSFMDTMVNAPIDHRMSHYRSTASDKLTILNDNDNDDKNDNELVSDGHNTNLALIEENITINDSNQLPKILHHKKHRRRNSDPEIIATPLPSTPAAPDSNIFDAPLPSEMHDAPSSKMLPVRDGKNASYLPPKNISMVHETNKKSIDKLLGFKCGHCWNFDNELVDVFMEQCKNVKYEMLVPRIRDIIYPTMLSSLALPESAKFATYSTTVKYNLFSFVSVEESIAKHSPIFDDRINCLKFDFRFNTTINIAIEELVDKIKSDYINSDYIHRLHSNCFVLKVCGREEYLKIDDKNNKIISLSYIRNCIRKNEILGMELVLLYDDRYKDLKDNKMRKTLRQSYNRYYYEEDKKEKDNYLEYENMGYNAITNTLFDTINDSVDKLNTNLDRLNEDIEQENIWLRKKVGSIFSGDLTSVAYTPAAQPFSSEIDAFEWDKVRKDAVLLPEFEHPVQIKIESLDNIMLCPRFRALNNDYYIYVLRIELMFGLQVFEQCSWDITIPKSKISHHISMPAQVCIFSTEDSGLHYASLPREAVWCFTLYGIKKDAAIEEELKKKREKQNKKRQKKEPKILRAFIINKKQQETAENGLSSEKSPFHRNRISSNKITEDLAGMIKKESFNDFYVDNNVDIDDNQYISEPLAWCRLSMIDHKHCLMKGIKQLKMWTVPIYEKIKGGPKIDAYSTGCWKKFGTIRDCNLTKKNTLNSVLLTINFLIDYKFKIVAPIVNQRNPYYIRRKIESYKKKDFRGAKLLNNIIQRDGIFPLDERDKLLIYSNKEKLMMDSSAIATFLRSVSWLDYESRMEAYDYLEKWNAPKNTEDMIELLRYEFADNRIRLYAINCLNELDDFSLNRCLLQLVQAIKCESQHTSFLSRFLIIRALNNPYQIGHYLFWHLISEYHDNNLQFAERFGLLLREYLIHLPYYPLYTNINLAAQLIDENNLIRRLKFISLTIKNAKAKKKWSNKNLMNLLQNELQRLNFEFFNDSNNSRYITLPLNPSYRVDRLQFEKCKFMSSAKVPLWLVFNSADRYCESCNSSIEIMFKCGDDLRQDILTLQLISIMDALWLSASIDLNMRVYEVIGTGYQVGMLQLITNSCTTNDIGSSFNNKAHCKYITNKTIINKHLDLESKTLNYSKSVAGFSVATWVLGIGDRHPDNIMIHQNGTLFHIDFGHFMGNFKEKDIGGLVKWKRERTPFVFTNAMKYCIEGKIKKKQAYTQFVKWLFNAYYEIRIRYKFFLNLLLLMVPSQMTELITESDVSYFREILRFDLVDTESIASHVESTLKLCLSDKNKKFDDIMHKIHHL